MQSPSNTAASRIWRCTTANRPRTIARKRSRSTTRSRTLIWAAVWHAPRRAKREPTPTSKRLASSSTRIPPAGPPSKPNAEHRPGLDAALATARGGSGVLVSGEVVRVDDERPGVRRHPNGAAVGRVQLHDEAEQ